jgi:hypothetical protein
MEPEEIENEEETNAEEPNEEPKGVPLKAGQIAGSAATEISFGIGGEIAAQFLKKKIPFAGVGARFLSGAIGSAAAQAGFEDKKAADLSLGRILAAGAANTVNLKGKGVDLSPATSQMIKGAAIAGGERTLADVIDTGEVDVKGSAIALGTGGLVGRGLGSIDAKYFSTAHKMIGKNAKQIDELIATNQLKNEDVAEVLSPILGKEATERQIIKTKDRLQREFLANELSQSETPIRSALIRALNYIAPARQIGKGAREGYYKYQNDMQRAEALSTKIDAKITKVVLDREDLKADISTFMDGGEMSSKLAKESIAGDLQAIRDIEIKAMKDLYDILEETDEFDLLPKAQKELLMTRMQEQIQLGYRKYDTATYKAFVDKKFTPTEAQELAAKAEVLAVLERKAKDAGKDISDEKVAKKIQKEVDDHFSHLQSMFAKDRRLSQKALVSSLPGRFEMKLEGHLPGPAERAFLGEVTADIQKSGFQAKYRIRDSRRHVAQIESNLAVINALKGTKQIRTRKEPGYTELSLPGMKGVDADGRQLYIPTETAHAISKLYESEFSEMMADGTAGFVNQLFGSMVAYSKAVKVIYNPPSYAVNAIGGAIAAASNGVNIFGKNYFRGGRLALAELEGTAIGNVAGKVTKKQEAAYRKKLVSEIDEMYEYGIGNASIAANEVAAAIRNGKVGNLAERMTKTMGKLYSVTDTATRYSIWKSNQQMIRKKLVNNGVNLTDDQVKRMAASITNDTYQNYERTSRLGKYLSRRGLLPPFVTFTLELARNTMNQARFAGEMVHGASFFKRFDIELPANEAQRAAAINAMRNEGLKRGGMLMGILAVSAGAKEFLSRGMENIPQVEGEALDGKKERDDFAFFGFSYMRDKDFMATINKENKKGTFAMTSYIFPHATLTQFASAVFDAASQGKENEYDTTKTLTGLISEELMGEGTFINQNVMRAVDNRDIYGEKITTAEGFQAFKELVGEVIFETFKPGVAREIQNLRGAINETGDFTMNEVLLRQIGARFTKIDFNQMAKRRIQDFVDRYSDARGNYTTDFKYKFTEGKMTPEEIERSYQEAVNNSRAAFDRIEEAYNRLDSFGYDRDEKIKLMKEAGVRSADIFRITKGMDFEPFKKGATESIQEQYDADMEGKTKSEKISKIRELKSGSAEDRRKADRLIAEDKRRLNNRRRGRSEQDLLLLNLNISDRTDLLRQMNAHIDRSLFLEMRRKGIINNEIARALLSR